MPTGDSEELLRIYAVLLKAKGANVTYSDIHDAWSAWMASRNSEHESLVEFEELEEDVQAEDRIFAIAVRNAAEELRNQDGSQPIFSEILFPKGPPESDSELQQSFDLYKMMVESSENLVSRRQGVNTFFLTINGALLTGSGIIVQNSDESRLVWAGIGVLAIAGAILCGAWRSLITSFGQLNSGKFRVINAIERYLGTAIYAAEWEALGKGENPSIYRSFTSREIWVPNALLALHIVMVVTAVGLGTDIYQSVLNCLLPNN